MKEAVSPTFDVVLVQEDMARRGWIPIDLARRAKVSHMTIGRFLRGERQTARTAAKIAAALGFSVRRYLISGGKAVA